MIRVSASEQVAGWVTALPPQTKHRVRLALRDLAEGKGDIKGLQGPLEGFCRLRVGGIRIIYRQVSSKEIRLDYAQTRDVVYEIFERLMENRRGE
jgi:mRNA-degrading endonuclease RelE of RelBE toxin-antitoxin system